jgi:hypothetical protein
LRGCCHWFHFLVLFRLRFRLRRNDVEAIDERDVRTRNIERRWSYPKWEDTALGLYAAVMVVSYFTFGFWGLLIASGILWEFHEYAHSRSYGWKWPWLSTLIFILFWAVVSGFVRFLWFQS